RDEEADRIGEEFDRLIVEGKLKEAAELMRPGYEAGLEWCVKWRVKADNGPTPEELVEQRRAELEQEERDRNDPSLERHRGPRGYRWRHTDEALFTNGELWQLAERQALEAARETYREVLQSSAESLLEVAEQRLAELKAEGAGDDDTWVG